MIDGNDPAYPHRETVTNGPATMHANYRGMTIRCAIAKDMMAAFVSRIDGDWTKAQEVAVQAADALIAELNKTTEN